MKETESAGGIVMNKNGEIALVRHGSAEPAWWGFPKGHIDEGEDALAAAQREIAEETGLRKVQMVKALGTYRRFKLDSSGEDDLNEIKTIHMFLFTTSEEEFVLLDPHHPEARWVQKAEVSTMLTSEKDRVYFASILPQL